MNSSQHVAVAVMARIAAIVVVGALAPHAASAVELANDGYTEGGTAAFQNGFVAGEIAAVRLVGAPCPARVQTVRLLFGGSPTPRDAIVHVWEDSAGTLAPGVELFSTAFPIVPSDAAFQELDLDSSGVEVCGPFRVGIEFTADGVPSVARDADGTVDLDRNLALVDGIGWVGAPTLGLPGDYVIRAVVPEPDAAALAAASFAILACLGRRRSPLR